MLKYLIILTLCVYGYLSFKKNNLNKEFYLVSLVSIIILLLFKTPSNTIKNLMRRIIKFVLHRPALRNALRTAPSGC